MRRPILSLLVPVLLLLVAAVASSEDKQKTILRTQNFDKDPGWEGFNNIIVPKKIPTVTQNFGYSPTNHAGKNRGEIGGRVTRSAKPTYYAAKIAARHLEDRLMASGTFAVTATSAGSGVFFGWFNAEQQDGCGRLMNSLGLYFDAENSGARLAVMVIGSSNRTAGKFITPFIPGKYRPTPIKNDGTRYAWTLTYDPKANKGNGQMQFTIKSNSPKPDAFEGKTVTIDLPAGFKKLGATFDRFGLVNAMKPGGPMTIYFDDLVHDGTKEDFTKDPGWVGTSNRTKYNDLVVGAHRFGYSPRTNFAGGKAGEVGGDFWRGGKYGYYADKISELTLEDRLEASGKVVLKVGAPDSDMYIGWFSSASRDRSPTDAGNFLGVHVGGPTRVGHYFLPAITTGKRTRAKVDHGPVLVPGKVYKWSLVYDPGAAGGKGAITVKVGRESVTLTLPKGTRTEGGRFDRFGLFPSTSGGQLVRIFFDELKYTAGHANR